MRKDLKYLLLAIVLASLSACGIETDKVADSEISPDLALKIGTSTYTVEELILELQSDELTVNNDGPIPHLIFENSASFDDTDEIVSVGTISNTADYEHGVNVGPFGSEQTIDFNPEPVVFDFEFSANDGEEITYVVFSGGNLIYEMTSTMPASLDYTWTIQNTRVISTGEDLSQSQELTYDLSNPVSDAYSRELLGLESELTRVDDVNEFNVNLEGDIILPAGQSIAADQGLTFELIYQDPLFERIIGYFGEKEIDLDSSAFNMQSLAEFAGDGMYFADPSITLTTRSSYGVDMLLNLDKIRGDLSDGTSIFLDHEIPDSERLVIGPTSVGDSTVSEVVINAANSNIEDIFNAFPDSLVFALVGETNPDVSDKTSNFVWDQGKVNMDAVVDIPMNIRMSEFEVEFDFGLGSLSDVENIETLELLMTTDNGMPFGGFIELSIIDEDSVVLEVIDELFDIGTPSLGGDGRVSESVVLSSNVALNDDELIAILEGSAIVATATLTTFQADAGNNVNLFSDYELKIDLSFRGKFSIKI